MPGAVALISIGENASSAPTLPSSVPLNGEVTVLFTLEISLPSTSPGAVYSVIAADP